MTTLIANAKNNDWTGKSVDLEANIFNMIGTWSYNDYDFKVKVDVLQMDFEKARDEGTLAITLTFSGGEEPVETLFLDIRGLSMHTENELVCAAIRTAHAYICNHV